MMWVHPIEYLKTLANSETADSTSAWAVEMSVLCLVGSVAYSTYRLNVGAMVASIGGLTTLATLAFHRDKNPLPQVQIKSETTVDEGAK